MAVRGRQIVRRLIIGGSKVDHVSPHGVSAKLSQCQDRKVITWKNLDKLFRNCSNTMHLKITPYDKIMLNTKEYIRKARIGNEFKTAMGGSHVNTQWM